jgi:hypothetical protein
MPFDRSTIRIELMTVMSVMLFVWPAMFLAQGALFITKAYLFGLFWDAGVHRLHLSFTLSTF